MVAGCTQCGLSPVFFKVVASLANRHLLWFCFSFVAVVIICGICKTFLELIVALCAFSSICLLFLFRNKARISAVLLILGIGFSFVWQSLYFSADKIPSDLLGKEVSVHATVSSFSRFSESGDLTFRAKLFHDDKTVRLIVYADDFKTPLQPGDTVRITMHIYELENTEFFAEKTYYKSRYVDAIAKASHLEYLGREENSGLIYFSEYAAEKLKNMAERLYSEKHSEFIKALLLGDTNGLPKEFDNNLRRTGMSHAVSVSGMHVSFIIGFIILFTKNKFLKLLAIPVMFCFAVMVGASQSALRAVIMQSLVLISDVKKREYDSLTSISLAAFILVFINPYCATDISFILSFCATLGIMVLFPRLFSMISIVGERFNGVKRKLFNAFASVMAVSLSATLFTSPITAYTFNSVSLIAPLSNILLSFPITVIFAGGFISLLLGFIFIPFGKGLAILIGFAIELVMSTIKFLSNFQYAEIFTGNAVVILTICFLCFVAVYSILAGRKKVRAWFSATVIIVSLLCVVSFKFISTSAESYEGIRFDVLDVGQGQCIVATSGDECVVIDCGGDKDADNIAIAHLLKRGIPDIDALILTHAHADHANGANYLTETITTGAVYMPATDRENGTFIRLDRSLKDKSEIVYVEDDMSFSLSDMKISIFTLPEGKGENENGLVVLVSDGDYEMLVTGDIPGKLEKLITKKIPDCESYIVGHHGSKSSTSQALINKVLPELCVVSVGEGNSYGHPAEETLSRIQKIGANIRRTDVDGTITFYSRGGER